MFKTDILDFNIKFTQMTGGFYDIFSTWWDYFGLEGRGLLVGHFGRRGEKAKVGLCRKYKDVTEINTLDLYREADITHDITKPFEVVEKYDWVVTQATLEHVVDPVAAIRTMLSVLKDGGYLYMHSVGPAFGYHQHPIDCYRFHKDVLFAWAELFDVELLDIHWHASHWFTAYRKKNG